MDSPSHTVEVTGPDCIATFRRFDLDAYRLFLRTKKLPESTVAYDWESDSYTVTTPSRFAPILGAEVPELEHGRLPIADHLFDYQRWVCEMALDARRFAVWLDTGLGKTAVYLEWARQVQAITGGNVLILAPLAVIPQTIEEARRFYGDNLTIVHLRTREALAEWCRRPDTSIAMCNYEKFIPGVLSELRYCTGLVADESSLLKTGGGTIKWNLIKSARGIPYKLSCTATPAPNDAMEYASQAAFLEKLRNEGDILWTYFQRDKYGNWSVKPHAKAAFYRFMASWSVYVRDPARFGFGDILSSLPDPEIIEERLPLNDAQRREMTAILVKAKAGMFADDSLSAVARGKLAQLARGFLYSGTSTKRTAVDIASAKPIRVADIVADEVAAGRQVLVWTTFDREGEIVRDLVAASGVAVVTLSGDDSDDARLSVLKAFRDGEIRCLISKPSLIGFGLNLQFVKSMVFSGFDDSFERMYQAIRRCYRFGQTETVRVHIPYIPELEGLMFANVRQKEARFMEEVATQEQNYRAALISDERAA